MSEGRSGAARGRQAPGLPPARGGGAQRPRSEHLVLGAPPAGRATIGEVAARAGVSKQTVSNVLNSPQIVRADTAARVQAAIDELGYRPHRAAQQLRTRRSRVLGLRVEQNPGATIFDRFLHAVTDAAGERDYRIMLYTATDDDAEIAAYGELRARWDIEGFLLTSTHPGDTRTTALTAAGVPFVTFGRPWGGAEDHSWVDVDGAAGTRAATEQLISLGHTRIAFLGWPEGPGVGNDREAGWADAITSAGLPRLEPGRCVNDIVCGRQAAADLLDRVHPTALVCVSDALGIGALTEISARGGRPGEDVSVIGFDDSAVAEVTGLASVAQPLSEVARRCAELLTTALERPAAPVGRHLLQPELVLRPSAGRPA